MSSSINVHGAGPRTRQFAAASLVVALLVAPAPARAAEAGKVFTTPEEAVQALASTVRTTNRTEFAVLFGDAAERLVNPDTVQGAAELAEFATAFETASRLVVESDTRRTLEVGTDGWPFPIPLVKSAAGWQFDTAAGADEILNRRIGRNELSVLRIVRAYVEAQREYASRDRDADEVLEFAQRIASSPGQTDGLFWSPEVNGEISPLGPLMAAAQSEGYRRLAGKAGQAPQPFHGYLFRILKAQGPHAPGGKHRYVINGNMIAGFGLVAWPVEYGNSGVMTFLVNQQGRVYEKDLGAKTADIVRRMTTYDPGSGWRISRD